MSPTDPDTTKDSTPLLRARVTEAEFDVKPNPVDFDAEVARIKASGLERDSLPKVLALVKGLADQPPQPAVMLNAVEARARGVDLTGIHAELANRPTCLDCARKHVGSARALLVEARLGYARHAWYAVGELAQAEAELVDKYDFLAEYVRGVRLDLMASLDPATSLTAGGPSIDPGLIKYPDWDSLMDALVDTAVTK